MGKIVAFVSGKGGTGKTTACAAIGSCLAALGKRVLAVDCDFDLRNLDLVIGMADFAVTDLGDVISGRLRLSEAAHEHPKLPGLFFLPAPPDTPAIEVNREAFERILLEARDDFDYILTDSPAGIGTGFYLAARNADIAIIVATAAPASVRDAARTADELRPMNVLSIRLLINHSPRSASFDDIIDDIGVRLIGVVREDSQVPRAAGRNSALVLDTTGGAARDFLDVALRLLD